MVGGYFKEKITGRRKRQPSDRQHRYQYESEYGERQYGEYERCNTVAG